MSFEEDCTGTWLTLRIGRYQHIGASSGSSTASAYTSEYTGHRGVSAGTSVVLGVGASRVVSVGLSAGISEALGIGGVSVEYVGASAGVGAASGVGLARFISEGASTGLSVVSGVGASRFIALGASAGEGVAEGVGIARFAGVGASVGEGAVSGAGIARFIAAGASAGDATVSGIAAGLLSDDDLLAMSGLQIWLDPLNTDDLTMGAAPSITNAGFDTDSDWTKGGGWSIGSGVATAATSNTLYQSSVLTAGNRYILGVDVPSYTSGYGLFYHSTDGTTQINGTGTWSEEVTAYGDRIGINGVGLSADCDNIAAENISVTAIDPRGGAITGSFSTPIASYQPWQDTTTGALHFEDSDDILGYTGTVSDFNFLHNGGGMTLFVVMRYASNNSNDYPCGTTLQTATPGVAIGIGTSNRLRLLMNNGGTYIVSQYSATDALPGTDTWCIVELKHTSGSNIRAWIDGALAIDVAPSGPVGSGDCAEFCLGTTGGIGRKWDGQIGDVVAFNRELTSQETTDIREKLADKWGITLP